MTAKEYLQSAYYLDKKISQRKEVAKSHRESLYGAGARIDGTGSRNCSDSLAKAIANIEAYDRETEAMTVKLVSLRFCIQKDISEIEDVKQREVLERRYLMYQSWKKIISEMNYSEPHIYLLHRLGLSEIEKIIVNNS